MLKLLFGSVVLSSTIRLATPILLAALGGSFGHKARVLNIGLESFIMISAFFAMVGSYLIENPWLGLLFAIISGLVSAAIFAVFVIHFQSNPIIVGIALNLAAWGITTFFLDTFFGVRGVFIDPRIKSFENINIPIIKDIPYLGELLSGYNIIVYIAFAAVFISYIVMYKTSFGLRLRGVGIKSIAAETVGVNVQKYKWIAILMGGLFSGIAGAVLVLGGSSMFIEKMSAGNGFLALAAIMVGDGNPIKVLLSSLVFGYTSALSVTLQGLGIPAQVVLTLPYIVTVVIMFVTSVLSRRKSRLSLDT